MDFRDGRRRFSPTDLANFLACRHKSVLDLAAAEGNLPRPTWVDPLAETLRRRGDAHEHAYVESLRTAGRAIADLSAPPGQDRTAAVAATRAAMHAGAEVIVQAALADEIWFGYADLLVRVEQPSALGAWSYEVHDTKLARETRGGTILQLCVYTELLAAIQATVPEVFRVVTPAGIETFRTADFGAYYRTMKARFEVWLAEAASASARDAVPPPTEHCEVCRWWPRCNGARRRVDHLSFVANLGTSHRRELESHGVRTLAALAELPVPLAFRPTRGAAGTYESLREQARLQLAQRESKLPTFELLAVEPGVGLSALPEPRPGDLFLDLESARFACEGGREYLFGLGRVVADGTWQYRAWWARDEAEEGAAFEAVMDEIRATIADDPAVHVYHFSAYEPAAFKRLVGRHGTRVLELDSLLRGARFVDLLAVVRGALRAGVESYSIKLLEPFYGFTRTVELGQAGDRRRLVDEALETGDLGALTDDVRATVEGYNADDCRSTLDLRTWLEQLRAAELARGVALVRPPDQPSEPTEAVSERQARIGALRARLLAHRAEGAPAEAEALRVLAYLLDWHYREDKVAWWEYFRLGDLTADDLLDERAAVTGLELVARLGPALDKRGKPTKSIVDQYRFPPQDCEIRAGATLELGAAGRWGDVARIDRVARILEVKKGPKQADKHPVSAFAFARFSPEALSTAIYRIGEAVAEHGLDGPAPGRAAIDLLMRRPPRIGGRPLPQVMRLVGESTATLALRLVRDLDDTVLPIQGPPGSGKTHTAAQMIASLVADGRRVGVTATGHKVIRTLLAAVGKITPAGRGPLRLGHKSGESDAPAPGIVDFKDNAAPLAALQAGQVEVLGGTAFLWARPEYAGAVDVLFVDEAGQMSLANVVAVAHAARSMVLLGDPRQLEQPQKGSHPDGVGVSALDHILGDHATMPADRGLFLPTTWRLAPALCQATSELFYDGKLAPAPGVEQVRLSAGRFEGAGLWTIDVAHEGNRNASDEEVELVARLVDELLTVETTWVDWQGESHRVTAADILVVAPYNAHVNRLEDRLSVRSPEVRVGTVDRLQGQEAPIVIYTMATSTPDEAPRGLEFLYSANRLNVATSRARAAAILVANPRLFEPECRTPRHMRLANALCRMRELAVRPAAP